MFLHTFNNIVLLMLTIRAQKVENTKQNKNTKVSKVTYQLVHKYKFLAETLTKVN